jgi:zinc D-Ala-D-Ala carboxypeptidase
MLRELHTELGIPDDYGSDGVKPAFEEADDLVDVGPNPDGRMQRLTSGAAVSWRQMQAAAKDDGIELLLISGFRSIAYQAGLIRRKLEAGQSVSEVLNVNAAPGYSEHHTGRAVDLAVPDTEPLTEEFESSTAFAWLEKNAANFGFAISYPRENRQGFVYEPWHWAKSSE